MIIKRYLARVRSFTSNNPTATNYAIDGVLVIGAWNLAANNNNLFAQRLGAGDFHLAMLQFLPQMFNLFLLIPAGLFVDSRANKGRILSVALVLAAIFFLGGAAAGFSAVQPLFLFLGFFTLANVSFMLYNISWQGYFPEVVAEGRRNGVLTLRTRMSVLISLVIPLISGGVLAMIPSERGKIFAHQFFYVVVAAMLITNAIHLRKITPVDPAAPKKIRFDEIKKAAARLLANRQYKIFAAVALFFHMTWHLDWTLYFIGQANYLRMNEFQLGFAAVGTTVAQLATLKFWSKRNQKYGPGLPMTFGILGLALTPVAIIIATSLPIALGPTLFLIMHTFAMFAFATIGLNFFQCLMPVLDTEYRGFSLSVYSCLIALSNAVMPVAGVALYRALGGNVDGLRLAFVIILSLRIVAAGVWWFRLKYLVPAGT